MNGWVEGWMDGWTDCWIDGWMDGWMDGYISIWMKTPPSELVDIRCTRHHVNKKRLCPEHNVVAMMMVMMVKNELMTNWMDGRMD